MSLILIVFLCFPALVGCASKQGSAKQKAAQTPANEKSAEADPLVAAALRTFDATASAATSGKVIGYLADWRKDLGSGGIATLELVVMADGTVYRMGVEPGTVNLGPSGKHRRKAPKRLGPEPPAAAASRQRALGLATARVERRLPEMTDATVDIFMYLVKINLENGSQVDMWVLPHDGSPTAPAGELQRWNPQPGAKPQALRRSS